MIEKNNAMFISNILSLLIKNGITKNKMLTDLKFSRSSFIDWIRNGNLPSGESLNKIADYFNVSVDYLLGKIEQKEKPIEIYDELDYEILNKIKRLSPQMQELTLAQIELYLARDKNNLNHPNKS